MNAGRVVLATATALIVVSVGFEFSASAQQAELQAGQRAFLDRDYVRAIDILRPLADVGDADAQFTLAVIYDTDGGGVPRSSTLATKYYRLAAKQDHAGAESILGERLRLGMDGPKDLPESILLIRSAAEQGIKEAQFTLGAMYESSALSGGLLPQNLLLAHMWSNLAAAQGHKVAARNRDFYAVRLMTPEDIAKAEEMAATWRPRKRLGAVGTGK